MKLDKLKSRFESIFALEQDAVFRYCFFRTSNREVALDLTQDSFMRFWDALIENREIKNDRAFLFTISRNLIIDYYRKKKATSLDSILEEVEDGSLIIADSNTEDINISAEARFVLEKIEELDPSDRQVVYLRFIEGMKPKEISEILNVSPNVISVRIVRALERLREIAGIDLSEKNE